MAEYDRFMGLAHGDPALAKLLHESLKNLAQGVGGPVMQELARDVLAGHVDLREVAGTSAYADAFRESLNRLSQWQAEVGQEETARLAAEAERGTASLREELERGSVGEER
jgi:hypothetical protein